MLKVIETGENSNELIGKVWINEVKMGCKGKIITENNKSVSCGKDVIIPILKWHGAETFDVFSLFFWKLILVNIENYVFLWRNFK